MGKQTDKTFIAWGLIFLLSHPSIMYVRDAHWIGLHKKELKYTVTPTGTPFFIGPQNETTTQCDRPKYRVHLPLETTHIGIEKHFSCLNLRWFTSQVLEPLEWDLSTVLCISSLFTCYYYGNIVTDLSILQTSQYDRSTYNISKSPDFLSCNLDKFSLVDFLNCHRSKPFFLLSLHSISSKSLHVIKFT